eukprot:6464525-Amphidinium_carterae.1
MSNLVLLSGGRMSCLMMLSNAAVTSMKIREWCLCVFIACCCAWLSRKWGVETPPDWRLQNWCVSSERWRMSSCSSTLPAIFLSTVSSCIGRCAATSVACLPFLSTGTVVAPERAFGTAPCWTMRASTWVSGGAMRSAVTRHRSVDNGFGAALRGWRLLINCTTCCSEAKVCCVSATP